MKQCYLIRIFCLLGTLLLFGQASGSVLGETTTFIKGFLRNPKKVSALFPCSSAVGEEIVTYLVQFIQKHPRQKIRVLEVGAGTGSMTEVIVSKLRNKAYQLDVIEIDPEYCGVLHDKFDNYPNISIHCTSITDFHSLEPYDFIISTLPFNSFEYEFTKTILNHLKQLIKSGGVLSYVAYIATAEIKGLFLWRKKKQDHKKKMALLKQWRNRYQIRKKIIFSNVPPINIYHLRIS